MSQALPGSILGRTGLDVTRLGYGAAHHRPMSDDEARAIHEAVVESGINFIDTADDYGNSEELIGRYLSGRRSELYLATKCGHRPDGAGHLWTRDNILRTLEESLRRLKTDYVDLMQLHNPTVAESEQGDLVDGLQEMKRQGKVRWIGASTVLPDLPTYLKWGVFDAFQIPYSALEREHEDWITKSAEAGVGIIIRGGVARGEPGVGTGREDRWTSFEKAGLEELLEQGESRSSFLLRYTLTHPHSNTIIVGTTNPGHVAENARTVLRGPLSPDTYAEVKRRMDAAGESPAAV
jgi:aryl-alcohol dehydrogenase-like predicted oxidoreductase